MNCFTIIEKAEQYVRAYMYKHKNDRLHYHNTVHTEKVVEAATQIALHYKLSENDIFIIVIACWFHDLGYYETIVNHERAGALMAEAFLKSYSLDEETINTVKKCILATTLPQTPRNLLEQIICDADLFHFGAEDFIRQSKLVKQEIETIYNLHINEKSWWNTTICFFENHHYHTDYCRNLLDDKKRDNLEKLTRKVAELIKRHGQNLVCGSAECIKQFSRL